MTEAAAREAMEYDVAIVGAGPAGLAAAIRLKQLDENRSVVVVEKGSTIGAHILSGVVIDPVGLDRLIPEWREDPDRPLTQEVTGRPLLRAGLARTHQCSRLSDAAADDQPRQFHRLARCPNKADCFSAPATIKGAALSKVGVKLAKLGLAREVDPRARTLRQGRAPSL